MAIRIRIAVLVLGLLLSLALSVSVVPLLARWATTAHRVAPERQGRIDRVYQRLLTVMVGRPLVAIAVAIALAAATSGLFFTVGTGFFPSADEGGFVLDYLAPPGSALAETDRDVRKIERILAATPEVASYSRRTGSELGLFATAQNKGDILVRLKPRRQRERPSDDVISDVREQVHKATPLFFSTWLVAPPKMSSRTRLWV